MDQSVGLRGRHSRRPLFSLGEADGNCVLQGGERAAEAKPRRLLGQELQALHQS